MVGALSGRSEIGNTGAEANSDIAYSDIFKRAWNEVRYKKVE
jgi:hypothetical protein